VNENLSVEKENEEKPLKPGDVKPDLTVPDQRAALAEALEH
jgi:hypothetical protein